jgi:tRNA pseudouridine38-40 synthase
MMPHVRRIRLVVEYDGTDFHGWQVQGDGARTVQGELQRAVLEMTGEASIVRGASRTDAGVHALGQVAHFDTVSAIDAGQFAPGLTALTGADVAVVRSEEAEPGFSARHDARGKAYRYSIWNCRLPSPLARRTSWHVRAPLDVTRMRLGAAHLVGEHDFAAFRAAACDAPTTVRTITRLGVEPRDGLIDLTVAGTAFLQHMVRIIVGTLVLVGQGRIGADDVARIRDSRDRREAGQTAPPQGLCLIGVTY